MSAGAHAAPRIRAAHSPVGPAAGAAARRALLRTGAFGLGLAVTFSVATVALDQGGLDAFATVQDLDMTAPSTAAAGADAAADRLARKAATLSEKHDCSAEGLAPGVIPTHAVVRVDGAVRLTSFDKGWAIYEGEAPGTLVSVCAR